MFTCSLSFRLLRLGRLMKKLDQVAGANYFHILKLMMGFALVAHWTACIWYFIGRIQVTTGTRGV